MTAGRSRSRLARRRASSGGCHRRGRPAPRLRAPAEHVPRRSSRRRRRPIRASRAMRAMRRALLAMGFSEAITFAFIEAAAAAPFLGDGQRRWRWRIRCRRSSRRCGRACCRDWSMRSSHNRRHGRRDVRLFEIGTRFSRDGRNARRRPPSGRGSRQPSTGAAGGARSTSSTSRVSPSSLRLRWASPPRVVADGPSFLLDGRKAELLGRSTGRSACVGQLDPAVAERRDLPAGDAVYVARARPRCAVGAVASDARAFASRCRVIRRSCATCRFWSTTPCLPRPFVARFERRARRRSSTCASSIGIRARAFRTARSAWRCA